MIRFAQKNRERGRSGKHEVTSFTNYYTGDPYIGSRDSELKEEQGNVCSSKGQQKTEAGAVRSA